MFALPLVPSARHMRAPVPEEEEDSLFLPFLEESFTEVGPDNTYRRMLASYSTYCLQLLVEGNHRRKRLFADTREE